MAVIKGKNGTVSADSSNIALVTSWSVSQEADVLETSAMGSTNKTYVGSLTGWSGSVECWLDSTGGQQSAMPIGTEVTLVLDTVDGLAYTGDAIITGSNASSGMSDVVSVSFDFQGTGALTTA
jgi:hypothetical protein|tara:strand:- start:583 stop:951 length:369 start_codon:yes stop_codon:yes gene_type:complete